jgi:hypothetical protein
MRSSATFIAFAFGRHWVVLLRRFDEATITAIAFVGDIKERRFLARSGKTNDNYVDLGKGTNRNPRL